MARIAISGGRARRNVRIAQMAGLALAVSAAALWALRVPGLDGSLPQKPAAQAEPGPAIELARHDQPATDSESISGIADRLDMGAHIESAAADPAPKTEGATTQTPQTSEWKYIAPIVEPGRVLAVLGRDGKQKVLAAGREWEYATGSKAKVVSVDENKVVLEDQGTRREIARSQRTGAAVQWTKMAANTPNASIPAGSGVNASIEQQLAARGIEGTQAQKFREAMRDRAAKRRAEAGVNLESGVLSPSELKEMGLSEDDLASMDAEALRNLRVKYNNMAAERRQAGDAASGADAAAGAPH
jgi:hypothetical protein